MRPGYSSTCPTRSWTSPGQSQPSGTSIRTAGRRLRAAIVPVGDSRPTSGSRPPTLPGGQRRRGQPGRGGGAPGRPGAGGGEQRDEPGDHQQGQRDHRTDQQRAAETERDGPPWPRNSGRAQPPSDGRTAGASGAVSRPRRVTGPAASTGSMPSSAWTARISSSRPRRSSGTVTPQRLGLRERRGAAGSRRRGTVGGPRRREAEGGADPLPHRASAAGVRPPVRALTGGLGLPRGLGRTGRT